MDKNWYEFDDTLVTRVNAMEVMSKEAYVLFYQKKMCNQIERIKMRCKAIIQNPNSREVFFQAILFFNFTFSIFSFRDYFQLLVIQVVTTILSQPIV